MKKENIKIIVAVAITFLLTITFASIIPNIKSNNIKELKNKNEVKNKTFAVMLQGENGYVASEDDAWPISGYTLNEELTNCIDNSGTKIENVLNYDNGQVSMKSNKNLFCYLYFDNSYLGQYIINNSISGLEKSKVTGDTLYRFSGTSGNTGINNYICLGTTSKCSSGSDEMYRIIGVEPSTGYVKVIKQTKYGESIAWNSSAGVTWLESDVYNSMTTWYDDVSFKSMIVSHSWEINDITEGPSSRENALSVEISETPVTAYVGMLTLSDYYLAYRGDQNWNSSYSNYTSNWIHLANNGNTSDNEWTMLRYFNEYYAWRVDVSGGVYISGMNNNSYAIRPVFYLNSTVNRISGSGTSTDPFIVE